MNENMNQDQRAKVQKQFGVSAHDYATSDIHARGESLDLLEEWVHPQPHWRALDVATGAGHTALLFASQVNSVIATDITDPMLAQASKLAASQGKSNIETRYAEAESLPFDDQSFELVSCRLARHHFSHPQTALTEMARVLNPGGTIAFTDNVTVEDSRAAEVYNRFERIRDPSHHRVDSLSQLLADFEAAGFQEIRHRQLSKEFEFHQWADRQNVSDSDKQILLEIMKTIPVELVPQFQPRWADDTLYFSLWEAVITATKPAS